MLTPSLAQEIARETSEVCGFNVVITGRDGVIIGSGDPRRIGQFHEASVEVARTMRAAAHDAAAARRLSGVRPGITLPIVLDDEAIGTVGITGSPSVVRRFGLLVKNQTEILLRESRMLQSRIIREKAVADLLRDIAHYDPDVLEPEVLAETASDLGFDLTAPRAAAVMEIGEAPQAAALRVLRGVFRDAQDVVGVIGPSRLVVLHRATSPAASTELWRAAVEGIQARHEGLAVRVGIGPTARNVPQLCASYGDAVTAVRLGGRLGGPERIHHIADFRLHELLAAAGSRTRARYLTEMLGDLREQPDWPALRSTLLAWCDNGFHLVNAAKALHIHRNTLIYRLGKIERVTGRSPREHRFALALYVAALIDELDS
ncbi:MAG TPA: sugar diacid recognition domain-containing protein [Amycolatopsis sp.]|uniref:CdaR family transcriptional regulator n=1 Tax=Amycolatopsis sp. TaxID=37632 RepID=UPI002B4A1C65|nr:sugar diacid recognition domain-containing protein [Amycolatopsis sp.]HKS46486.1 sugar diacid recognition domain-containing protein [Amycolatopsis sp.]